MSETTHTHSREFAVTFGGAAARDAPRCARPDDRRHRAADDRRRPRRPRPAVVGRHRLSARRDDLDAAVGQLSDLYGRKRLFQAAIVVFLAGSALSGLAQSLGELIGFRALQGLGAGGLMTLAMAIVAELVSPRERGRYQGYIQMVFVLASVAGPLLGGVFVDQLSWRWVFYVNLPIGLVALALISATLHLPATSRRRADRLPRRRAARGRADVRAARHHLGRARVRVGLGRDPRDWRPARWRCWSRSSRRSGGRRSRSCRCACCAIRCSTSSRSCCS